MLIFITAALAKLTSWSKDSKIIYFKYALKLNISHKKPTLVIRKQ